MAAPASRRTGTEPASAHAHATPASAPSDAALAIRLRGVVKRFGAWLREEAAATAADLKAWAPA